MAKECEERLELRQALEEARTELLQIKGLPRGTTHCYTLYEALNLANQNVSRKLGDFAGSWRNATSYSVVILINIFENLTIMVSSSLL